MWLWACRVKKALFNYDASSRRGHRPPFHGCPQCVLGQACQRPRRRARSPEAFTSSLDLAGPYAICEKAPPHFVEEDADLVLVLHHLRGCGGLEIPEEWRAVLPARLK